MPEEAITDETSTETDTPEVVESDGTDWKAEARKHEQQKKRLQREMDDLKKSTMSDSEKLVAEAEKRGRMAAVAESAQIVAAARIEAALTGIVADPAEIVSELNLAKYVTDDGDVDTAAVAALKAKFSALAPQGRPGSANQGARSTTGNNVALNGDPLLQALKSKLGVA